MIVSLKQGDNPTLVIGDYIRAKDVDVINEKNKTILHRIQFLNGFNYWHFNSTQATFGDEFVLSERPIATIIENTLNGIIIFTQNPDLDDNFIRLFENLETDCPHSSDSKMQCEIKNKNCTDLIQSDIFNKFTFRAVSELKNYEYTIPGEYLF